MTEVRITTGERARLKTVAHRIFDRLVVLQESTKVNSIQDRVIIGATLLAVVIGCILAFALTELTGLVPMLSGLLPETMGSVVQPAVVIIAVLILGVSTFLITTRFSDATFLWVGRMLVTGRRTRPQSDSAKSSVEQLNYWVRNDPARPVAEAQAAFGKPSGDLLPAKLTAALREMSDGKTPTVLARGFTERGYAPQYLFNGLHTGHVGINLGVVEESYFRTARALRNVLKVCLAFDVLDSELRDEAANGLEWARSYSTKRDFQHVCQWDGYDMPLRYRTVGPQLRWPSDALASSDGEIPLFRAIACLENPMTFPIQVMTVRDIVAEMPETMKELFDNLTEDTEEMEAERRALAARALRVLATRNVPSYGKRDIRTLTPSVGRDSIEQPLFRRLDGESIPEDPDPDEFLNADWGVRWDPNRIILSKLSPSSDGPLFQALSVAIQSVNNAMRKKAQQFILRRGDVLFVDNQRAMVRRCEHDYRDAALWKRLAGIEPAWWLRGFYGFRVSRNYDSAPEIITPQFSGEAADVPPPTSPASHGGDDQGLPVLRRSRVNGSRTPL